MIALADLTCYTNARMGIASSERARRTALRQPSSPLLDITNAPVAASTARVHLNKDLEPLPDVFSITYTTANMVSELW